MTNHQNPYRRLAPAALALALVLGLAGCGAGETSPDKSSSAAAATPVSIPETELGTTVTWTLEQLNAKEEVSAEAWAPRLAESLSAELSAEDFVEVLNTEIRPQGPFTPISFTEDGGSASVRLRADEGSDLQFSLTLDDSGQITGVYFRPVK